MFKRHGFKWTIGDIWYFSRIRRLYWKMHYKWDGNCGHFCANHIIYDYEQNEDVIIFIPECACPVHDQEE